MNDHTDHRRTYRGALMLPSQPFQDWLTATGLTTRQLADLLDRDEAAVRRRMLAPVVSELVVERAGILIAGEPRLCEQLYPEQFPC
jgi:hypothetical protein